MRRLPLGGSKRQASLEREVYYDAENVRRDVVTYKPPEVDKLGNLSGKYKLSNEELAKYKMSMSELCHKMKAVSNASLALRNSQSGLDEATRPLKMEVSNQARKYNSTQEVSVHIDTDKVTPQKSSSSSQLAQQSANRKAELSNNVGECKKSLTDIRDRIGSLQSLLKTSRTLTASKQQIPNLNSQMTQQTIIPSQSERKEDTKSRKTSFTTNRSDSYAKAIDDEEGEYEETHFPYNPSMPSTGNLLCDQPENRQSEASPSTDLLEEQTNDRKQLLTDSSDKSTSEKTFDIRALSPSDNSVLPLTTPEPDSTSTMTLLADETSMSTLTMLADRSPSACSQDTLEGDDIDTDTDTESLL